ncbi:protein-glutamate O-methyltransferase CheR [Nocardioides panacihumi]|uniref:protein-glutamate O-methyltransferase n=1 Tax=Nocardioides panacihumi TaxID=400774 RepID=A0ABN2QTQ6_9ACTN
MTIDAIEFDWVADLVRRETAIVLGAGKEYLVETRLTPLAYDAGEPCVEEWVRRVRSGGTPHQRRAIVEALTTNETSWFRDGPVFDVLRDTVLPGLLSARGAAPVRLWSAAASTGQEAYSLAMLCHELDPHRRAEIIGTDVASAVVGQAAGGCYDRLAISRGLTAQQRAAYFQESARGWRIDPSLQRHVSFRTLNLARPFDGLPRMDLVLLRNVLIYFDAPTRLDVLRRVRSVMAPGGWLLLGTAESANDSDLFVPERIGAVTLYRPR